MSKLYKNENCIYSENWNITVYSALSVVRVHISRERNYASHLSPSSARIWLRCADAAEDKLAKRGSTVPLSQPQVIALQLFSQKR